MKLKSRAELKSYFRNGGRPSERDFEALIHSVLNQRDDQLLGRWRPGISYRTGDIVFYGPGIWELTDDGEGGEREICSEKPPEKGDKMWRLLLPARDEDWILVDRAAPRPQEGEGSDPASIPASMHANPRVKGVGIGTDSPHARLEVTDGKTGRFLFELDRKVDPALGIIKVQPEGGDRHLAIGVGDDAAALVTDSDQGFAFRAGGACGVGDHEIDVAQGEALVRILPEGRGRLGIGRGPEDYQLDVHGLVRSHGVCIDSDETNLADLCPLEEPVLAKLAALRPVRFRWKEETDLGAEGVQLGLVAQEVEQVFPEAVRTSEDDTKAVAMHALVPLLLKAIQEQGSHIRRLEKRLEKLEKRAKPKKRFGRKYGRRFTFFHGKPEF